MGTHKRTRTWLFPVLVLWAVGLIGVLGLAQTESKEVSTADKEKKAFYAEIISRVSMYNKYSLEELMKNGNVESMIPKKDKYARYMSPSQLKEMMEGFEAKHFVGIGILLGDEDGALVVRGVFSDGPAKTAGVRVGDVIVAVDGLSIKGMKTSEVIPMVKGEKGTVVNVTFTRSGKPKPFVLSITRANVALSVTSRLLDSGYGYISFRSFRSNTLSGVVAALAVLEKENKGPLKGIVIDLRYNPGGYLHTALALLELFSDEGEELLYTKEKGLVELHSADSDEEWGDMRIVVLVNEHSASASEVFSGTLKGNNRACIVGRNTYGKGTIQSIYSFSDGSALKVTIGEFFGPSKKVIQGVGVAPHVVLNKKDENEVYSIGTQEAEIKSALEALKNKPEACNMVTP